jgi:predicted amidohydrolase
VSVEPPPVDYDDILLVKICLAQFQSNDDVEDNLRRHVEVAQRASAAGCSLVLFPELSVTGYWPSRAAALAIGSDAPQLRPLVAVASELDITIAAGAPLKAPGGVQIGMFIIGPEGGVRVYGKQRLHADELPFFVPGTADQLLCLEGERFAPAICYESLFDAHAQAAVQRGATVYMASVAKPAAAIARAHVHYRDLSVRHAIPVVVANAAGQYEDLEGAGRSAAWAPGGELRAELADGEGALIVEL